MHNKLEEMNKTMINSNDNSTKETIGDYIIEKTVGQGTFGKVKLGTHILTGEKVAIKILQKDKILDESDKNRVYREIRILKQIRHPNLIHLYEIIETQTDIYLIMEYSPNGELYEYIVKKKKLAESEAFFFFQQILSGIEYLHKINISHRDLKLENLLISYNDTIKIVDFGLSNFYDSNPFLLTSCGSPCYAAPEMILGQRYNGLKTDLWSLGIILFAMTCGHLPFENKDTTAMYKKVIKGEYEIPKHLSDSVKILIKGLLSTDPKKRFTIEDIRKCNWYSSSKVKQDYKGIIVGIHEIPIDRFILDVLENFNVDKKEVEFHLKKNHHNHYTSLYYLLLEKYIREGGKSTADIKNIEFNPNILRDDKLDESSQLTKRKFEKLQHSLSPTNKNSLDSRNETKKEIDTIKEKEESPLKKNFKVLEKKELTIKTIMNSLNSPKIYNSKIPNKSIECKPENITSKSLNEKNIGVGFQSDRFEPIILNCDTLRRLDFKDKKYNSIYSGIIKPENYINTNQKKLEKKSNKSISFYQSKFPFPSHFQTLNNIKQNSSILTAITTENNKSFHQNSQSQNLKEKKIKSSIIPKQPAATTTNKEKMDNSRNIKSKSIDNNNKKEDPKKILNVTLLDIKKKNKYQSINDHRSREKSISFEKIKENIDKALFQEKPNKTNIETISSFENSPPFFSNENTNKKTTNFKTDPDNNRKSYYQLAYLLKEKNFPYKNINKNKDLNTSRSRFKSMYTVKTEVSSKKTTTESQKRDKLENSDQSRSDSRSQSLIKKKIEAHLKNYKIFTFTKRENESFNKYNSKEKIPLETKTKSKENIKKTIFTSIPNPQIKDEIKKPEKNIINIENFLRYSQKFRNLKSMQKDLEKLLSKDFKIK